MQVETYEIEDSKHSDASTMALDAEAAALVEALGLEGQKSLQNPETLTRCPYPVAEAEDVTLFRVLNGESCAPENYNLDPIPVRVLQVLQHAKSLDFFTHYQVWYPKRARVQDPVLVAFRTWRPPGRTWDTTDTYILARWGKMLEPLDVLSKRAVEAAREKFLSQMEEFGAKIELAKAVAKKTGSLEYLAHGNYLSLPS